MLLSMINISDGLLECGYSVNSEVQLEKPTLRGVRLLVTDSDEEDGLDNDVAYVSPSNAFISAESTGTIICCRNDILFIENSEPEIIFNECSKIFEYYNQWERQLLEAIIDDRPLDYFIDLGHRVFQSPMFISGLNDQTYAITKQYDAGIHPVWRHRLENGNLDMSLAVQNHESEYFRRCFSSQYPLITYSPIWKGRVIYCNLWNGHERIGSVLAYEYDHPFRDGDVHLMQTYGKVIEKILQLHPKQFFPMSELENMLIRILNKRTIDWGQADAILRRYHWEMSHQYGFLYVESASGQNSMVLARAKDAIKTRINGICAVMYKDGVLILLNQSLQSEDTGNIIQMFQALTNGKLVFGSSLAFFDLTKLEYYAAQACAAARLARDEGTDFLSFEEIFGRAFWESVSDNERLRTMVHPDIQLLSQMDGQTGTNYCKTLYAYLLCGCNYREASGYLAIHRNTMLYRVEKIRELLNCDFEDIRYRQILLVSLLLNQGFLL